MSRSLLALLLLPSFALAAQNYRTVAVKVQTNGDLCIFQAGVGFVGDLAHCSSDKVPKDAIESNNAEIDTLEKTWPKSLIDGFVNSRPRKSSGGADFKVADFRDFMKGLESNPTCASGRKVYQNQMKKIEGDRARLDEMANSAERTFVSSCAPERGLPQKKPDSGSGSSTR